jgi:hypothetical protein
VISRLLSIATGVAIIVWPEPRVVAVARCAQSAVTRTSDRRGPAPVTEAPWSPTPTESRRGRPSWRSRRSIAFLLILQRDRCFETLMSALRAARWRRVIARIYRRDVGVRSRQPDDQRARRRLRESKSSANRSDELADSDRAGPLGR